MLKQLERAEQKWGGANTLIDQWLNHRRKLLVNYCQIAGLPPYESLDKSLPEFKSVKEFCDLLVDYVSEGHFEVYDRVVTACEKNGESTQNLAQTIVPKISETTDLALDFNDKYTEADDDKILYQLDKDLSSLAHAMETRFELEDKLLEVLHANAS
ncbi:Rsd/AlgQ family anti-sigma factor [Shewanella colwelliana]|uniref:Anti-RNA polymerase sigma 70 factor n=1 Tax=Shewanella colwelliana TaxID=23 RepID=A0A1E5IWV9_SHECO|nr:Rsd/AlgQ family anti-sigma factor [Shewanella colwelliana]MCZ4339184.1 Rsd/AlgQ family anti-sigma factor [Shewanella colwelliana]MDX1282631.1 Rsd/AlgQ family anti-sigma factor [Shewanella colwelliana]OEG75041.1 anti-RNA polymerase sigma 70 factor [Shewanella colwelliana]GIU23170.1 sigma D regulator [Shewanella colwelliana]GIU36510.1 sigma D regulator [Shewanella colwelliana]